MSGDVVEVEGRKPRGPYKIGPKLRRALKLLGEGKRLSEAALLANMTPRGLSLALRRQHVVEQLSLDARAALVSQLPKATATLDRVMGSDNMAAALNGARFVLGTAGGIVEPTRHDAPAVSISIDVKAGYILDLTDRPRELPRP